MSRGFISPDSRGTLFTRDEAHTKSKTSKRKNHFSLDDGANAEIQTQNVKSSRVYVFGQADIEDEDNLENGMEMSEIRPRGASGKSSKNNNTTRPEKGDVLEREIVDGDTLQSIALQYGCQVSELKRINNLIRDQEFFALKVIKVPIRRHGLLTELLEQENKKRKNGPKLSLRPPGGANDSIVTVDDVNYEDIDEDEDPESQSLLVRTLSIRDVCNNPSRDAKDFLRTMDHDLEKIRKSTNSYKDSLEEVAKSLTCKRIYPIQKKTSLWNGADCGLHWRTVILIVVAVALVAPITYFLYFEFGKPPD